MSRLALILGLLLLAAPVHAGPPPGWGKPKALPPANGTGTASFRQGGHPIALPLQELEVTAVGAMRLVSLKYVDATQTTQLELTFGASGPGPVPEAQVTGLVARSKAGGVSRVVGRKTRCGLLVRSLSDGQVEGSASCSPMFRLDGASPAPDVTELRFTARAR